MRRKGGIVAETGAGLRAAMAAARRAGQTRHAWHNPTTHCRTCPAGPASFNPEA